MIVESYFPLQSQSTPSPFPPPCIPTMPPKSTPVPNHNIIIFNPLIIAPIKISNFQNLTVVADLKNVLFPICPKLSKSPSSPTQQLTPKRKTVKKIVAYFIFKIFLQILIIYKLNLERIKQTEHNVHMRLSLFIYPKS